ncbi:hypothetical protein ILUMI_03737 [Ignelater luminosus]|uniref:Glutamate dehydrogenase n=1 Tax=Ignelater luminosus TaxID=2038154 RepID=A0A8K0DDY4_IGNLU|nr:hypothetical protein ILUMI_03737 [Ignelater luminosus]
MALNNSKLTLKNLWLQYLQKQFYSQKYEYEIPDVYRNAFYLANASLVNYTNWFVHNALRVIYHEIITELKAKGHNINEAIKKINSIINIIEPCNHFIDVQFPVKMEDGQYEIFRGFRAEHGVYIRDRPCLGGLRLWPKIEKSDIKALASISTYKYACMGIDLTGAYGGIVLSRDFLQEKELQRVIETYTKELTKKGFCGESVDVFEPDMNCGSNEMTWIIAANSKLRGNIGNACAVGKPFLFGGVQNREKAVAQGIFFGLDVFLQNKEIMRSIGLNAGWSHKTFILQGLGNVGSFTGLYLENAGVKCVGIVECDSHIYDGKGISIHEAIMYKRKNGSLKGFKSLAKCNEPNKVLIANCDILVLAAAEKSLVYYIADKVKARIVIEAANGPLTPSVHKILVGRNKLVLPDIYINSGSSIASYFEYLKNIQHLPLKITEGRTNELFLQALKSDKHVVKYTFPNNAFNSEVLRKRILSDNSEKNVVTEVIDNIMQHTAKDIIKTAKLYNLGLDFRTAAYIKVLKKLFWTACKF